MHRQGDRGRGAAQPGEPEEQPDQDRDVAPAGWWRARRRGRGRRRRTLPSATIPTAQAFLPRLAVGGRPGRSDLAGVARRTANRFQRAGPVQHVVPQPTHVDELGRRGDAARPLDVRPGHPRRGDPVAAAVPGDRGAGRRAASRGRRARTTEPGRRRRRRRGGRRRGPRSGLPSSGRAGRPARRGARRPTWSSAQRASGTGEGSGPSSGVPAADAEPQQPQGESLLEHAAARGRCASRSYAATRRSGARPGSSPAFAPPCSISTTPRGRRRRGSAALESGRGHAALQSCRAGAQCFGDGLDRTPDGSEPGGDRTSRATCRRDTARWTRERDRHPDRDRPASSDRAR